MFRLLEAIFRLNIERIRIRLHLRHCNIYKYRVFHDFRV